MSCIVCKRMINLKTSTIVQVHNHCVHASKRPGLCAGHGVVSASLHASSSLFGECPTEEGGREGRKKKE